MPHRPAKATPSIPQVLALFQGFVPATLIRTWMQAAGVRCYERLFTPVVVVWCLLFQRLHPDHTLDAVVSHVASGAADGLGPATRAPLSARLRSQSTAAYSQARARMPLAVLQQVALRLAEVAQETEAGAWRWQGHPVRLIDGSTLALRPEGDIPAHYGLQRNQFGTAYWVVLRTVVCFDLGCGALVGAAEGPWRESEQALAKQVLLAQAGTDSIYVGDRNFGVFSVAQAARQAGGGVVLRLTRGRARRLAGRTLQPGEDLAVRWAPSTHDQYDPELSTDPIPGRVLSVRLEQEGFRPIDLYLFTSLCDAERYRAEAIVALYGRRWHVELNLRYVKSTLDLQLLQAKSVAMAQKEFWAGLATYNLVRGCMAQAAAKAGVSPLTLSFARCRRRVQQGMVRGVGQSAGGDAPSVEERFWEQVAQCRLQRREAMRMEPRLVRLRSRAYGALKGSREEARQKAIQELSPAPAKS